MINATIIHNPIAGRRRGRREKQIRQAGEILRGAGMRPVFRETSCPGSARQLAQECVAEGCDLILVCGGDGTINEVINGMAESTVPLGILPGGTANIIAKEIGLPHNPVRAAEQILQWKPQRIALGRAMWQTRQGEEQRYFLSVAGVGFDAHVIRQLPLKFKDNFGVVAYAYEAIRQTFRYPFPSFRCQTDGQEFPATFAVAQRTRRYAGWIHLAPNADFLRPILTCCLFRGGRRARYATYAAAVLLRQHPKLHDVKLLESSRIVCNPENPETIIYFELDGELVGQLPVQFDVAPDTLTLLMPY